MSDPTRIRPTASPRLSLALFPLASVGLLVLACSSEDAQTPAPGPASGASGAAGATGAAGEGGTTSGSAGSAGSPGVAGAAGAETGSAGSAGSEAGSGGASGGGGAGPDQDPCDTGSCLSCTACLSEKTCKAEYKACFEDDPDCQALQQCYLGCDDAACRSACNDQAPPSARDAAEAFLNCSLCKACQTTCGPDPSCAAP